MAAASGRGGCEEEGGGADPPPLFLFGLGGGSDGCAGAVVMGPGAIGALRGKRGCRVRAAGLAWLSAWRDRRASLL